VNATEFRAALARRADIAGVPIDDPVADALFRYFALLQRWNKTINLTSLPIDDPTDQALDRLLIEPLTAACQLAPVDGRWFDLGSGGGSPAIPMKLALPALRLTMIESRERKAAFLREVTRELGLSGVDVQTVRFETLQEDASLAGSAGLITLRAVRIDEEVLRLCAILLHKGGQLVLLGFSGSSAGSPLTDFTPTALPWLFVR